MENRVRRFLKTNKLKTDMKKTIYIHVIDIQLITHNNPSPLVLIEYKRRKNSGVLPWFVLTSEYLIHSSE